MSVDLDAIRGLLKKATYLPDTGHAQACSCPRCVEVWSGASAANEARHDLLLHVVVLVEEVEKLRHLLERKTTACDEWITIANERRLELEALRLEDGLRNKEVP